MNKKLIRVMSIGLLSSLLLTGCMTSAQKELNVSDGKSNPWVDFDGREGGNYVIINSSGGTVYDVWKLENKLVSSIDGSDGWEFVDAKGNLIRVGGDCLVMRCKDKDKYDSYKEYHWTNVNVENNTKNGK